MFNSFGGGFMARLLPGEQLLKVWQEIPLGTTWVYIAKLLSAVGDGRFLYHFLVVSETNRESEYKYRRCERAKGMT
jgi:hypothetical protein